MKDNINKTTLNEVNVLNNLPYPNFLAFNFKDWFFEFNNKNLKLKETDSVIFEKLIKKYNNLNTIILFNGEIIFNSAVHLVKITPYSNNTIRNEFNNYIASTSKDKLIAINKINLNSGLLLEFANNSVVKNLNLVIAGSVNLSHYNNIVVGENADIKILEEFVLFNNAKLNYNVETSLLNNAKLQFVQLQNLSNSESNCFTHSMSVNDDANLDLSYFNLSSANVVNNSVVKLVGKNSNAGINTIAFANKKHCLGSLIVAEHLNKHTYSSINNVAFVNDQATYVVDGLGVIEKGNSKSVAEQESKIVNLKDTAKSVANPQLIINEYDVKAGHAAAVGRVDEEQLYYLMSRGLKKYEAIELLVMSYANEYFEKISDKSKVNKIKSVIKNKIK